MSKEFLWVEKYRPKTVQETILPDELKQTFQKIVDSGEIPNMMFTGTAGLGKTTVARAICNELGLDYIVINGSEEGNIDTLRGKIKQFASSVSLSGGYKVVILDEADYLNPQSTQPALRGFIEEFSQNCRFILTCNFKNKVIEPLHSRCGVYEFNTTKKGMATLCGSFMTRLMDILNKENITYNKEVIANLITKHAPDWRRILNESQRGSIGGGINTDIIVSDNSQYSDLYKHLKEKDFKKMRQWVVNNVDTEPAAIFRGVYDTMEGNVKPESIPQLILILADYQYKNAFVADHELNMVACLTECMANVEYM
ncbi:MAG: DNA polymerase [Candidatus Puniceispirillum sp. TMED52]|nr:MAG: DNA polymerase [Candidatus Puniceispirillum sp. TMED52]|tara:strand:- start:2037 stop:2972 length:936 start_codon:yes stop_codon:yes gene_type:complete